MYALFPQRPILARALTLVAPMVLGVYLARLVGGRGAMLGVVLGVTGAIIVAVTQVSSGTRLLVVAELGASAALGAAAAGRPLLVAAAVAVGALAQAPLNRRSASIAPMVPVAAATGATVPAAGYALPLGGWVVAGGCLALAIGYAARIAVPAAPVTAGVATRHAVALAATAAVAAAATTWVGMTHGHWLILTLALALSPQPGATTRAAIEHSVGTAAGVLVTLVAALLLPTPVSLALSAVAIIVAIGWALARDRTKQALFSTPAVLLASSSGAIDSTFDIAATRLVMTLLGAGGAVLAATAVARWDARSRPPGAPAGSEADAAGPGDGSAEGP